MSFQNVSLTHGNFCFGPNSGQIYSIDYTTNTLLVKTYPSGLLVNTIPLDYNLNNEVLELHYDGMYFYTLIKISVLGIIINKWKLNFNSTLLEKQVGNNNEIVLLNFSSTTYDCNSFCVQTYRLTTTQNALATATSLVLNSVISTSIGDSIYIIPSVGNRIEKTITSIDYINNVVYFSTPIGISLSSSSLIINRKYIWLFNDYSSGSIHQIDSYNGWEIAKSTSSEWKHVSASTCDYNGDLVLLRESQVLFYRPYGINAGYQKSYHISNIEADNTSVINATSIQIDSSNLYKLQKKRRILNTSTSIPYFQDEVSNFYEIEQEVITPKILTLTSKRRTNSVLFGKSATGDFDIVVTDQYGNTVSSAALNFSVIGSLGSITVLSGSTTNIYGEAYIRYNTGLGPLFAQPYILSKEITTSGNVKTIIDQVPSGTSLCIVEQVKSLPSSKPLEQRKESSSAPIITQVSGALSYAPIEQVQTINRAPMTQVLVVTSGTIIEQTKSKAFTVGVEQVYIPSAITSITQYDFLLNAYPEPYSLKNPIDSNLTIKLGGNGITLNSNTLVFKINGIDVSSSIVKTFIPPYSLLLEYNPPINFPYSSTVYVDISIKDTDPIPRTISTSYTFGIVSDYKKPILYQTYPPDNSIDNLPNTIIYAIIKDLETGINLDSIEMYIEGRQVTPSIEVIDANTCKVSYQPTYNFAYRTNVFASIFVKDLEDNSLIGSWSFDIKDSSGVLFTNMNPSNCSVLVPVDSSICTELFGLEDGINLNTLEFNVDGKRITYVIKPKVIRTE